MCGDSSLPPVPSADVPVLGRSFDLTGCSLGSFPLVSRLDEIHDNITGLTWHPRSVPVHPPFVAPPPLSRFTPSYPSHLVSPLAVHGVG